MKQAIEESRVRNTKLETVFIPYGAAQQFVLRLISVSIIGVSSISFILSIELSMRRSANDLPPAFSNSLKIKNETGHRRKQGS